MLLSRRIATECIEVWLIAGSNGACGVSDNVLVRAMITDHFAIGIAPPLQIKNRKKMVICWNAHGVAPRYG